MSDTALIAFRPNSQRVYIAFCPSSSFWLKYDAEKESKAIEARVYAFRLDVHHADERFCRGTLSDILAQEETCDELTRDWDELCSGHFGSLWLYGDAPSEFTRQLIQIAAYYNLYIKNFAIKDSILDKYLKRWFRIPNDR